MSFELPSAASFAGFPSIRRSRGFRLYTPEGRRFLDLYQDAGRGMLGSRPKGLALRFKNSLDKLGPAAMPSIWEHRAARLLNSFFPDYPQVSVFPSYPEAMKALEARLGADSAPVRDPLDAGLSDCAAGGRAAAGTARNGYLGRGFCPEPEIPGPDAGTGSAFSACTPGLRRRTLFSLDQTSRPRLL